MQNELDALFALAIAPTQRRQQQDGDGDYRLHPSVPAQLLFTELPPLAKKVTFNRINPKTGNRLKQQSGEGRTGCFCGCP
jgi:hypothetical protein